MAEFNILKYRPAYSKKVAFRTNPPFLSAVGRLDEEYYHEEFGLYTNDDTNALAHAAVAIERLQKNPGDRKQRERLAEDFENYVLYCLGYGIGKKDMARQLMETMLGFGMDLEVVSTLEKYLDQYRENVEENGAPYPEEMLDFPVFYRRAGDCALFQNYDVPIALAFYRLADTDWGEEKQQRDYSFEIEKATWAGPEEGQDNVWIDRSSTLNQIWQGQLLPDQPHFRDEYNGLSELKALYEKSMVQASAYDITCIDSMNKMIELVGTDIVQWNTFARTGVVMLAALQKNRGAQILYLLSREQREVKERYVEEIILAVRRLPEKKYGILQAWLSQADEVRKSADIAKTILRLVQAVYHSERILDLLRVKNMDVNSAYYTSYDTFSLMLPDRCEGPRADECGKLSVMNVAYMNDPNEGMVVRKHLYGEGKLPGKETDRKEIKAPYVFIKCFTSMVDYLPMWQMYGDGARGVCILVDWSNVKEMSLYRVCYLTREKQDTYKILAKENPELERKGVENHLNKLKIIIGLLGGEDRLAFDSLIEPIPYLFKDSSYSYEQEMRIMYRYDHFTDGIRHTKQDPPKLFVVPKNPVQIKELIFGPKFSGVIDLLPYLQEQLEKMALQTGTKYPQVTVSNIEFR